jgi:hypothetical protein
MLGRCRLPATQHTANYKGDPHMKRLALVIAAATAITAALNTTPAFAQAVRTFVSGHGTDTGICGVGSPCRTFAYAITQTSAGGEIDVLDPAGYGAVTITKAVSIQGHGFAGVSATAGGTGITISAGASDAINLRGLLLEGDGSGLNGIQFNSGQAVTVDSCVVRHFLNQGMLFAPNASSNLLVSNSLAADNGGPGISVFPNSTGTVTSVFSHVAASNNGEGGILVDGIDSTGTITATVADSVAAGNSLAGFAVVSHTPATTTLTLFHSVAANNATGISASGPGSTLTVAQSMITGNASGWTASVGAVDSYGDNYIDGNASNQTAPPSGGLGMK